MTPRFYFLDHPEHPWADYGDILTQGMAERGEGGLLELERTGPFIPPITFPATDEVVVTHDLRQALERSGLKGLVFEPVVKRLIVWSDWHTWDQTSDEPAEYPESGEPEDYILGHPHSTQAADQMGDLWAIRLNRDAQTDRLRLVASTWQGHDIFGAQKVGFVYATESAKSWFERLLPGQLAFQEVVTAED